MSETKIDIGWLKSHEGTKFAPKTFAHLLFNEDGSKFLNTLEQEFDAKPGLNVKNTEYIIRDKDNQEDLYVASNNTEIHNDLRDFHYETNVNDDYLQNAGIVEPAIGNAAVGRNAFAEGSGTVALGDNSHAEGSVTQTRGYGSHAEGIGTYVNSAGSHVEGVNTQALLPENDSDDIYGMGQHAEGMETIANNQAAHAEGYKTKASGLNSHSEGYETIASGDQSHAEGNTTIASNLNSHAEGNNTKASGINSHAEGGLTQALGEQSHAEGYGIKVCGKACHAEGSNDYLSQNNDYALITSLTLIGSAGTTNYNLDTDWEIFGSKEYKIRLLVPGISHIEYQNENYEIINVDYNNFIITLDHTLSINNDFNGSVKVYFPYNNMGEGAHTEGLNSIVQHFNDIESGNGNGGHAEGIASMAIGFGGHTEGLMTLVSESAGGGHAEGVGSAAMNLYAHAEGEMTKAWGIGSHSEGLRSKAYGDESHAEGNNTNAYGEASHAEGYYSKSQGNYSHAEGNSSLGYGKTSHAEGTNTVAYGDNSHSEGGIGDRQAQSVSIFKTNDVKQYYIILNENPSHDYVYNINPIISCVTYLKLDNNLYQILDYNLETQIITLAYDISGKFQQDDQGLNGVLTYSTTALGNYSHAENMSTVAMGESSHSEGNGTTALGYYSHVEGEKAVAFGDGSHAEGRETLASGNYSHTEGLRTQAMDTASHTEGWYSEASGIYSHAEGAFTLSLGEGSHSEGKWSLDGTTGSCQSIKDSSTYIFTTNSKNPSLNEYIPQCYDTLVLHEDSMLGKKAITILEIQDIQYLEDGNFTITIIGNKIASEDSIDNKALIACPVTAFGNGSHAEGRGAKAIGAQSHSEGNTTQALGNSSHAEGSNTTASGLASHSEGVGFDYVVDYVAANEEDEEDYECQGLSKTINITKVDTAKYTVSQTILQPNVELDYEIIPNFTYLEGEHRESNAIWPTRAKVIDYDKTTHIITLDHDLDFGLNNDSETQSVCVIRLTEASGKGSHAEGWSSIALGRSAHSEGRSTIASGKNSHAEGSNTIANAICSHAEGYKTIANAPYQHVQGLYNIIDEEDTYLHIVGNGLFVDGRSNAHTIDKDGNAWFAGDVYVHSTSGTNQDEGSVRLATINDIVANGGSVNITGAATTVVSNNLTTNRALISNGSGKIAVSPVTSTELNYLNGVTSNVQTQLNSKTGIKTAGKSFQPTITYTAVTFNSASEFNADSRDKYYIDDSTSNEQYTLTTSFINGVTTYYVNGASAVTAATGAEIYNDYRTRSYKTNNAYTLILGLDNAPIGNIATGTYSHAEGVGTTATGGESHAEGQWTYASGSNSHAEGYASKASGHTSHAEGAKTIASGDFSHSEGMITNASNDGAHSEGRWSMASGIGSHAEGQETIASGNSSHAEGFNTKAKGSYSHSEGLGTTAYLNQHVQGRYNVEKEDTSDTDVTVGSAFIIGNGSATGPSSRSNAFRVTYAGATYAKSAYNSSGADYAEFFEWQDGNPNKEDRRGYFVTLENDKIKIATPNDYILGVVSGQPSVIGNSDEEWMGRYILDEFGCFITEEFEYQEENRDPKTGEITVITKTGIKYKENPEYDPTQKYIQRQDRPEWSAVGMLGMLSVRDDGTCKVNSYCSVNENGIATISDNGYRVIKRINDNVVKIIFK